MERWLVPCPHCEELNDIKFSDIRFDKEESVVRGYRTYKATAVWYVSTLWRNIKRKDDEAAVPEQGALGLRILLPTSEDAGHSG